MSDWWDDIDDREQDAAKAAKLANALSKLPGDRVEKVRFLELNMALMEAEADREGAVDARQRRGVMVSLAFRYWRHHLLGEGKQRPAPDLFDHEAAIRRKDEAIASWAPEKREQFFQDRPDERKRWESRGVVH